MTSDFDPRQAAYRECIRELEALAATQRAAASKTERKLAWYREGLELFAPEAESRPPDKPATPSANGTKPVLREAILRIMREGKATGKDVWKAPEVISLLGDRSWLPNGDNADHIVRSRLSTLTKANELERVGYGQYALPKADPPGDP